MALGLTYGSNNEDIVPVIKYDARAGRFTRVDRTLVNGSYVTDNVDITKEFKAVFDMENVEVGFLKFMPAVAPEFKLVKLGQPVPAKPTDPNFKQGVRFMLKLHSSCGGDVREQASSAAAFMRGFDVLHTEYETLKAANPGKLPVVVLTTTEAVTTGSGQTKSTNYQPHFTITGWAPRPSDLVFVGKADGTAQKLAGSTPPSGGTPPSTGSTVVPPPNKAAAATAGADDFG
jgi:hypothetical protein